MVAQLARVALEFRQRGYASEQKQKCDESMGNNFHGGMVCVHVGLGW